MKWLSSSSSSPLLGLPHYALPPVEWKLLSEPRSPNRAGEKMLGKDVPNVTVEEVFVNEELIP
jgi:hypothetical protein